MNLGFQVRPDDLIYLLSFGFLVILFRSLPLVVLGYGATILLSNFIHFYNALALDARGFLFVGRYTAFALMVGLGAWLRQGISPYFGRTLWRVLSCFAVVQAAVVIAQRWGALPIIIDNNLVINASRATGMTSHPTELGFVNLLLIALAYQITHSGKRRVGFYFVILCFVGALVAADSRTSLVGGLVMICLYELYTRRGSIKHSVYRWALSPLLVLGGWFVVSQSGRVAEVLSSGNATFVTQTLRDPRHVDDFSNINPQLAPRNVDPSLYVRIKKWGHILADVEARPLTGSGPGAYGAAVDGLYMRILGEGGILGLAVYLSGLGILFFSAKSFYFRLFFLAILFSSIFIDALFFSRFAYVFYLYAGLQISGGAARIEALGVDTGLTNVRL
ncbi:hypothetical protein F8S09_13275 [Deinococcus sp. SDU3-2]|uniref:O-antigen ligase domain-containing protein n=1 Tax=Deinococcus terrestris TaxID=2651870 RepID=A0A7X1TSN9_9DEIO|nr:hypothetical protein [Deinococcus terrestris]MPY67644.1 hypothetical protein [Deinococcus terrestris]